MHDVGIYENLILGIHFLLLKKCKIFDEKTIVRCYTGRSMRIKVRKHERRGYQSIKMSNILEKQFLKQRNDFEKSCVERDKKYHFPQGVILKQISHMQRIKTKRTVWIDIVQKGKKRRYFR